MSAPNPLSERLREVQGRLEELRRYRVAAEADARVHRVLLERLRGPLDAGQVEVVVRDGRLHLRFTRGHEYFVGLPATGTCRNCCTLNELRGVSCSRGRIRSNR